MLANYIKIAIKVLARRKFFTFISLFGISFTLLVLMVATAMIDNVFAPRAPESKFDRVIGVYRIGLHGEHFNSTSNPGYRFVKEYVLGLPGAEATSVFSGSSALAMYHDNRKVETHLRRTDGAYWQILDFDFVEGGPLTESDNANANFVAVMTDDMRTKLYGRGSAALGKTFEVDGQRFRVIGVVRAVPITREVGFSEIWVPIRTMKTREYERQMMGSFGGIVLARKRSDFDALRREFALRTSRFVFEDKTFDRLSAGLDTRLEFAARATLGSQFKGNRALVFRGILAGLALLFMLLPTMNLVSINLSRIMERASEIGVRKAFGASSRALIGQFIVENVVLTVIGGLIGFVLSVAVLSALSRMQLIPYAIFDINLRIFFYGLLIAVFFGLVSGVYPAWRMSRIQAVNALRGGAL
ncbi:MAG TPA: ABC transporter permease [Thermoanaerobaculia bacterium]|jgi:putative ABC transport system permease protein|nr:ABC transporter permease [Thermoanaerobaculia bacterium]